MSARAGHEAAARRVRFGLSTAVLLAATTAACVLAGVLASRYHLRWDVTASGQHTLAPRTLRVLKTVEGAHTIIVSANRAGLPQIARTRVNDLLVEFTKADPDLRVAWIDTGSGAGQESFALLLDELASSHEGELASERRVLSDAAASVPPIQEGLNALGERLVEVGRAVPGQQEPLERQAGLLRALATRLQGAMDSLVESASATVAGVELPAIDRAQREAAPLLDESARAAGAVAEFARRLAETRPDDLAGALAQLAAGAERIRDAAARSADAVAQLEPSDPLIVARTLEAGDAVLVTGPRGTVAIDFPSLFPAVGAGNASPEADLFTGEQLIATALGALNNPSSPIVVFVHAENTTLLEPSGAPTPVARQAFGATLDRLRLMRFGIAEWAVARQGTRPDLSAQNPRGERPVVFVVFGAPSRAALDPREPALITDHSERVDKLGAAIRSLLGSGANVLLSVEPSDRPAIGDTDPCTAPLEALGVSIDTARPLIRRESSPTGPLTFTALVTRDADPASPIGRAIDGLAVVLSWPSPITLTGAPGVRAEPILRVPASEGAWGEAQWFLVRALEARSRQNPLEPLALAEPPAPELARDLTAAPPDGWLVSVGLERPRDALPGGSGEGPQRVVVVSAAAWFDDLRAGATRSLGGQRVRLYPGNAELFDASLFWLAGLDDLIAPGPQVRDVPRIARIQPGALTAMRWVLIAGLPLGVLLLGALIRLVRG